MKPCEGKMYRKGKYVNRNFYNEREWRYVPAWKKGKDTPSMYISKEDFLDKEIRKKHDAIVYAKHVLSFGPSDIKYIIVKKESEKLEMVKSVERIKGSRFSLDQVKLLSTTIISKEQILSDF